MKMKYFLLLFFFAVSSLVLAGIEENREYVWAVRDGDVGKVRELLEAGVKVDTRDTQYDKTALMIAASTGNIEMMELLLSAGAKINKKTRAGKSVLGIAVQQHQPESVKFLLRNGARIKSLRKQATPATFAGIPIPQQNEVADALYLAVHRDDDELLKMLLEAGTDVDAAKQPSGRTVLMEAAYFGKSGMVELLLEAGASVNLEDEQGNAAFNQALRVNNRKRRTEYPVIISLLLENGAKPVGSAAGDAYALAIHADNFPLLESLVSHGVDVNAPTRNGDYALTMAVKENSVEMSRYLIEHGADPENRDREKGRTAIFYSLKNPELFWLLAENHVSFNVKDNRGYSLTRFSFSQPDREIIKAIINSGSVRDEVSADGNILVAAVSKNMTEIVELLIRQGANIDFQSAVYNMNTPLQLAFHRNNMEVALLLINVGADVSNIKEGTAPFLVRATKKNNVEVIRALLRAGADVNEVSSGSTALYTALGAMFTSSGIDIDTVDLLLEKGARADAGDAERNLFVMWKVCAQGDFKLIKELYAAGAPVNRQQYNQRMPLIGASANGSVEIIEFLLDRGARINDFYERSSVQYWDKDEKILRPTELNTRQFPLTAAAGAGNKDALALLVEQGADVNVTTHSGMSTLMMVVDGGVHAKEVISERRSIFNGQYETEKSRESSIAALKAFKEETRPGKKQGAQKSMQNVTIIESIDTLSAGPEPKYIERQKQEKKKIQDKKEASRPAMMRTLIKAGIDVNRQDEVLGLTSLMQAVRISDPEAVNILLDAGARIDLKDKAGRTAADHATEAGNREIVELIRRAEAG
jgi:ankyrin repeat protein